MLVIYRLVSWGRAWLTFCPLHPLGTRKSIRDFHNLFCLTQGAASLLLANLEKEKELLRIFLRVSQMENAVLRRMNLNSFLMVSHATVEL